MCDPCDCLDAQRVNIYHASWRSRGRRESIRRLACCYIPLSLSSLVCFWVVILLGENVLMLLSYYYCDLILVQKRLFRIKTCRNRLCSGPATAFFDFVAVRWNVIANGPWKRRIREFFHVKEGPEKTQVSCGYISPLERSSGRVWWISFEDDAEDNFFTLLRVLGFQFAPRNLQLWSSSLLGLFLEFCLRVVAIWPPPREAIFTTVLFLQALFRVRARGRASQDAGYFSLAK